MSLINPYVSFILENPPRPSFLFIPGSSSIYDPNLLAQLLIDYNNQYWHFGKNVPIMSKSFYNNLIDFIISSTPITNSNQALFIPKQSGLYPTYNTNTKNFWLQSILPIIKQFINIFRGFPSNEIPTILNTQITINLNYIFPLIPDLNLNISTSLLGLAALIGAEHLTILFLINGANPSVINKFNQDSAYPMIKCQIVLHQYLRILSQKVSVLIGVKNQFLHYGETGVVRQSAVFKPLVQGNLGLSGYQNEYQKYFINVERIKFILTLLAVVGNGIDLTLNTGMEMVDVLVANVDEEKRVELMSNLMGDMCKEDIMYDTSMIYGVGNRMDMGNDVYKLVKFVLERNGIYLHFFSNLNVQSIPFGFTPLFYLLGNRTLINMNEKLLLVDYMIQQGVNPMVVPNFMQKGDSVLPIMSNLCRVLSYYYQGVDLLMLVAELDGSRYFRGSKCGKYLREIGNINQLVLNLILMPGSQFGTSIYQALGGNVRQMGWAREVMDMKDLLGPEVPIVAKSFFRTSFPYGATASEPQISSGVLRGMFGRRT